MRHPDEGTIHAWLDGALDDADTAWIEAHSRECPACGALVAEARGLVAGASRVLGALDAVPGGVMPMRHEPVGSGASSNTGEVTAGRVLRRFAGRTSVERSPRWMAPMRAAAALLLVAGGTAVVMRSTSMPAMMESAEVRGDTESAVAVPATAMPAASQAASVTSAELATAGRAVAAPAAPTAPTSAADAADAAQQRPGAALRDSEQRLSASRAFVAPPAASAAPQAVAREESNERRVEQKLLEVAAAAIGRPSAQPRPVRAPLALRRAPDSLAVPPTEVVVTGVVRDDHTGEPVAGASILFDNGDIGTITDHLGRFTITGTTTGIHRAQVRRMGYASAEREVSVVGDSSVLDVRLAPSGTSIAAALGPGYTDVNPSPERRKEEPLRREDARRARPGSRTESATSGGAGAERTLADSVSTTVAPPPSAPPATTGALPLAGSDAAARERASVPLATRMAASAIRRRSTQRDAAGSCLTIELSPVGSSTAARAVTVRLLPTVSADPSLDGKFGVEFPLAAEGAAMRGSWRVVPRAGEDERTATEVQLHWMSGDEEVRVALDWARTQPDGRASVRRDGVGVDARATATRLECRAVKPAR